MSSSDDDDNIKTPMSPIADEHLFHPSSVIENNVMESLMDSASDIEQKKLTKLFGLANTNKTKEKEPEVDPVLVEEKKIGQQVQVLVAKTSLEVPVSWDFAVNAKSSEWINALLDKKLIDKDGNSIQLWRINPRLPKEVFDLDPHFRYQLGCYVSSKTEWDVQPPPTRLIEKDSDRIWRLELTEEARILLFNKARIESYSHKRYQDLDKSKQQVPIELNQNGETQNRTNTRVKNKRKIKIEAITLVVFPYGCSLLQFHVNWLPDKEMLSLDNFRTWLYLAKKFRKIPNVYRGWSFGSKRRVPNWQQSFSPEHIKSLGTMCLPLYENRYISLLSITSYLTTTRCEVTDNIKEPSFSRVHHHTTCVIEKELEDSILKEYLFHLRHAMGQVNRPPHKMPQWENKLDCVIESRKNRYIGITREGAVSLSWPITHSKKDNEIVRWPLHFQGIYQILRVHTIGEKLVLSQLSTHSSLTGRKLRWISGETNLEDVAKGRRKLLSSVALVTQYTMQMSSDDCGGYTEYVQFFTTSRRVFTINKQREELNLELRELLHIMESNFNEELRKLKIYENKARKRDEERKAKFEIIVGTMSSIILPIILVGTVFGMNNNDTPISVSWTTLIWSSSIFSGILLLIFWSLTTGKKIKKKFNHCI